LPVPAAVETTPARYSTGEAARDRVSLLGGPMEFRAASGGRAVALKAKSMRVVERGPAAVVIETVNEGEGFELVGRTTVEFDGLVRVDMEVRPTDGACKLDGLRFVIPFKQEYATLLGNFRNAPGPGQAVHRYLGLMPKLPWSYPVFYAQTIGTDRMGLQWICDSTRGWRLSKPMEGMQIQRVGENVEEVFHLIDHPVELTEPMQVTFGLMALPVKPLPEGWGRLRITSGTFSPPALDDEKAVAAYVAHAKAIRPDIELSHNPGWSGTPWYPYYFQDAEAQESLRRSVALAHEMGIRYCPHSGWQAISTLIPEWPAIAREMAIEPETETIGKTVFACYNSPYSEFTAALWAHHARTLAIDGVKADTMFPQTSCSSLAHGCGWYGEDGKLYPSVNLFATRTFFKRLYRIFHGGIRENGITNAAQTGVTIAPVCSFTDIVNISEGHPYHKAKNLKEGYPQDLVRTLMVGAQYGVVTLHDLKGEPLNAQQRIAALLVAGADPRFLANPAHYLPGYAKRASATFDFTTPCVDIWEAYDWIDRGGAAVWMPHWENGATLSVSEADGGEGATLYGSMYVQRGKKILLVVTNYEERALHVRAKIDFAALGFEKGQRVWAEDAVTDVPIEVGDEGVELVVLNER